MKLTKLLPFRIAPMSRDSNSTQDTVFCKTCLLMTREEKPLKLVRVLSLRGDPQTFPYEISKIPQCTTPLTLTLLP